MPIKDPRKRKLSDQQRKAVEERAKPDCPTNVAAIRAAYPKSCKWKTTTINKFACDFFKKPHIEYALEKEMDKLRSKGRNKTALSAQRVIDEFKYLALASITDVVQYEKRKNRYGVDIYVMKITEFDKLTDDTKRAMKKIKIRTKPVKEGEGEEVTWHEIQEIEFELYDKQKALDSLAKYFDLYVEKLEIHHTGTIGHVHTTVQEMRTLFDAMTPEERATHLDKLMGDMTIDVTNDSDAGGE